MGYCARPIPLFTGLDSVHTVCYIIPMKLALKLLYRIAHVLALIVLCAYLNGCATYTIASGVSLITTQKSIGDHVLSNTIPHADCSAVNIIRDKYYCEVRDISRTYNRTGI